VLEVLTVTGIAGQVLYGPQSLDPSTELTVLAETVLEGRALVSVSFLKGTEEVSPQTSLGALMSDGRVDLSAVFWTNFEVEWAGGGTKVGVRPAFGEPDWWVGEVLISSKGIRHVLANQWWCDFEEFWAEVSEEQPEKVNYMEQMFKDHQACEVRYARFSDLAGTGDCLEALAGGYLWTLLENPDPVRNSRWACFDPRPYP